MKADFRYANFFVASDPRPPACLSMLFHDCFALILWGCISQKLSLRYRRSLCKAARTRGYHKELHLEERPIKMGGRTWEAMHSLVEPTWKQGVPRK